MLIYWFTNLQFTDLQFYWLMNPKYNSKLQFTDLLIHDLLICDAQFTNSESPFTICDSNLQFTDLLICNSLICNVPVCRLLMCHSLTCN